MRSDDVWLEDLCFDAQQAAEKALKAVLIFHGVRYPRTHNLRELANLLAAAGSAVPVDGETLAAISNFAVLERYPGMYEPVSEEDYLNTIATVERVVEWAEAVIAA